MVFRLLQVGLGNRGNQWAEVVGSCCDATIAGVVDTDSDRIDAYQSRWGQVPAFDSLDRALSKLEFDAVLLVTPPDGHLAQAERIFAAGRPLLAEKPLAMDLREAAAIVRLADRSQLPLAVGLNFRYLPVTQAMRSLITEERFGTAGFGQFTYQRNRDGHQARLNKYPLTMLHPMMLEQSIHHLDLIRFVYGREVEAVACRTWNPAWSMYAHDANVACLLTLEGGLEVSYLGTWTGGWNELQFEWRTDCSKGVIIQRELFGTLATANTDDTTLNLVALPEARPFFDDTRSLLQAFIGAVRRGGPPPCTGRDHLRSLALCFAAIEASETGRRVMTSDFHARHNLEDFV